MLACLPVDGLDHSTTLDVDALASTSLLTLDIEGEENDREGRAGQRFACQRRKYGQHRGLEDCGGSYHGDRSRLARKGKILSWEKQRHCDAVLRSLLGPKYLSDGNGVPQPSSHNDGRAILVIHDELLQPLAVMIGCRAAPELMFCACLLPIQGAGGESLRGADGG